VVLAALAQARDQNPIDPAHRVLASHSTHFSIA
jgi:hypothetical protein